MARARNNPPLDDFDAFFAAPSTLKYNVKIKDLAGNVVFERVSELTLVELKKLEADVTARNYLLEVSPVSTGFTSPPEPPPIRPSTVAPAPEVVPSHVAGTDPFSGAFRVDALKYSDLDTGPIGRRPRSRSVGSASASYVNKVTIINELLGRISVRCGVQDIVSKHIKAGRKSNITVTQVQLTQLYAYAGLTEDKVNVLFDELVAQGYVRLAEEQESGVPYRIWYPAIMGDGSDEINISLTEYMWEGSNVLSSALGGSKLGNRLDNEGKKGSILSQARAVLQMGAKPIAYRPSMTKEEPIKTAKGKTISPVVLYKVYQQSRLQLADAVFNRALQLGLNCNALAQALRSLGLPSRSPTGLFNPRGSRSLARNNSGYPDTMIPLTYPRKDYEFAPAPIVAHWTSYPQYAYDQFYPDPGRLAWTGPSTSGAEGNPRKVRKKGTRS